VLEWGDRGYKEEINAMGAMDFRNGREGTLRPFVFLRNCRASSFNKRGLKIYRPAARRNGYNGFSQ